MSKHTKTPSESAKKEEGVVEQTTSAGQAAQQQNDVAVAGSASEMTAAGVSGGVPNAAGEEAVSEVDALKAELVEEKQKMEELQAKYNELNEKYLRVLAEEVNFRKRMTKEKEEAAKYAISSLLSDLIPILDDFDRGLASAEASKDFDKLHEGILLIQKQLSQMLENKYSLKRFESAGKAFDPNRHEALFAEAAAVEEPTVVEEYLPGYSLHDRVLRTAKVRVKVPGPTGSAAKDSAPKDAAASDKEPSSN
ncbi:MAG: nucleotide exchange factor GrpE [Rectinema sp.]